MTSFPIPLLLFFLYRSVLRAASPARSFQSTPFIHLHARHFNLEELSPSMKNAQRGIDPSLLILASNLREARSLEEQI
jgi:hypothetical protein